MHFSRYQAAPASARTYALAVPVTTSVVLLDDIWADPQNIRYFLKACSDIREASRQGVAEPVRMSAVHTGSVEHSREGPLGDADDRPLGRDAALRTG